MTEDNSEVAPATHSNRKRLAAIELDGNSIRRATTNVEHEREVAIYDLIDENQFGLPGRDDGPYKLMLSIVEDRLVFDIKDTEDRPVVTHVLSLTPLRRVLRDYFIVCDSYYQAIRSAPASRIQAIDMGRRGLHDEGSRILSQRLEGKIEVDHTTARRLFTLISALHWKG